jgi:hypothetical protein
MIRKYTPFQFISSHARLDGVTGWVSSLPSDELGNERGTFIDTDGHGIEVFRMADYDNSWDGNKLPAGTYYYVI